MANPIEKNGVVTNVGFDAYGTHYDDRSYAAVGYTDHDAAEKLILCTFHYYDP